MPVKKIKGKKNNKRNIRSKLKDFFAHFMFTECTFTQLCLPFLRLTSKTKRRGIYCWLTCLPWAFSCMDIWAIWKHWCLLFICCCFCFFTGSQAEEEEGAAGGKHVIARGNGRKVGTRPHATVAQKIRWPRQSWPHGGDTDEALLRLPRRTKVSPRHN